MLWDDVACRLLQFMSLNCCMEYAVFGMTITKVMPVILLRDFLRLGMHSVFLARLVRHDFTWNFGVTVYFLCNVNCALPLATQPLDFHMMFSANM